MFTTAWVSKSMCGYVYQRIIADALKMFLLSTLSFNKYFQWNVVYYESINVPYKTNEES